MADSTVGPLGERNRGEVQILGCIDLKAVLYREGLGISGIPEMKHPEYLLGLHFIDSGKSGKSGIYLRLQCEL